MKKYYIFLTILFFSFFIHAQIIDIPDANFKNALVNTPCVIIAGNISYDADTNDDGEISISEAEAVNRLDVNNQSISSLVGIEYFINLTNLRCRFNDLTTLDLSLLTNLDVLVCDNNQLSELNLTNTSISFLDCYNNELTELDLTGLTNLSWLNCRNNQLADLNFSSLINLSIIDCGSNLLSELNVNTLTNLQSLTCNDNNLSQLDISSLINLGGLFCSNNQLTDLDITNSPNLDYLDCGYNNLNSIDFSAQSLFYLFDCSGNNITSLNLTSLEEVGSLYAGGNQLASISLCEITDSLWVADNLLTELDLSNSPLLDGVFCANNLLTTIDISNNPIIHNLYASNNELTSLNLGFAEVLSWQFDVFLDGNPNLSVVCTIEDNFDEVQNKLTEYGYTNCTISSYCSFEPNGEYYVVQGQTKFDSNNDGCDATDAPVSNLQYTISSNSINDSFLSNANGEFNLYINSGSHTITPYFENPDYFTVSPTSISVDFPTDISPYNQNFCVTSNGIHKDIDIQILPLTAVSPGFQANYRIIYSNTGNTLIDFGQVLLANDYDLMSEVSFNPSWSSFTFVDNTWHFNFENLHPFETRTIDFSMLINTPTDIPAVNGGDILTFEANYFIEYDLVDSETAFTLNQTVVNSFDPNDKTCLEGDFITPEMAGDYVHYMIRFENTGTANAINIVVKDDIDVTKYDLSTLIPLHASHNYITRVKDQGTDHYVEFIFEDINLPFDDANNDGYIAFKIKTLDILELGDSFENNAEIYFDYNFPIITNNAITTIASLSVDDFEFANSIIILFPNPTTDMFHLKAKQAINQVYMYDVSGRLIKNITVIGFKNNLDISTQDLSSGTYFIKIKTTQGESVKKVIKQ